MVSETRGITKDSIGFKKTIRNYYERLYPNECDNLDEMYKFLERQITKMNSRRNQNMNKKIKFLIEISPANKILDIHDFTGKVYQRFKEEIIPILQKVFLQIQEDGTLPSYFMRAELPRYQCQTKTSEERKNI